ncbi:MAG: hypothetical protein WC606_03295 [Candidatus Absconditabacterales bacterium]
MADVITPTNGTPQGDTQDQDLQINLESNEQDRKIPQSETENTQKEPELDLNLDLNLPEAQKNDDRLKKEDQKNSEPVVETKKEVVTEVKQPEEIPQQTPEAKTEEIATPTIKDVPSSSEVIGENIQKSGVEPMTKIQEIPASSEIIGGNPPESSNLQEDIKMIDELEGHKSAGGLAPEAIIIPQKVQVETPKTFDLDTMLGNPVIPSAAAEKQPETQNNVLPPFTIPTTTTQIPIQTTTQTVISKKNTGVKTLLFVILFAALGFTTFFILKTMYPVEFENIFSGGQTKIEIITGAIEELTGTELTGTQLSGEQISGAIDTGTATHESAVDNGFGELNDLGTTTTQPEETDVSRLTDYINQGNDFLAQGKTISNNIVIKYGLYISKKATAFLEKIANGEQINNLSGYFAQFDQYLIQLKELVGQSYGDTTANTAETGVSPTLPTNGFEEMTGTTPTTDTGFTSE